MKLKRLLLVFSSILLSLCLSNAVYADTNPRISHTLPAKNQNGKYVNDVTVVNYTPWVINLSVRFLDGTGGSIALQPAGTPNFGDTAFLDLYNDEYATINIVNTVTGKSGFNGNASKGCVFKITPSSSSPSRIDVTSSC